MCRKYGRDGYEKYKELQQKHCEKKEQLKEENYVNQNASCSNDLRNNNTPMENIDNNSKKPNHHGLRRILKVYAKSSKSNIKLTKSTSSSCIQNRRFIFNVGKLNGQQSC